MKPFKIHRSVILLALGLSLVFPVMTFFVFAPAVDRVLVQETEDEALRMASHIEKSFMLDDMLREGSSFSSIFLGELEELKAQFNLYKISVLSGNGEVLISTDMRDVGFIAHEGFFTDIVATGKPYAVLRKKKELSLELVPLTSDVVEAYLPVMSKGRFVGAIEVYYDISEAKAAYDRLKKTFAVALFIISFGLLVAINTFAARAEESRARSRQAERDLSHEQLKSEAVFSAMEDSIIVQDLNYRILYQNKASRDLFGDRKGEFCYSVFEGREKVCDFCPVELTYRDGAIHSVTRKDMPTPGGTRHFELTSSPMHDENRKIIAGVKVVRDITESINAAELLKRSEGKNRALLEAVPDTMILVNRDGRIVDFRGAGHFKTDATISDGLPRLIDVIPEEGPHLMQLVWKAFDTSELQTLRFTLMQSVSARNYEARIVKSATQEAMVMLRDITEHRALEDQLRQSQKMEAIGTLASGISHEFNNILTAIVGFGELLRDGMEPGNPLRNYVDMINYSARRATDLVRGLMTYSRKQDAKMQVTSVDGRIQKAAEIISRLIGVDIEMKLDLGLGNSMIIADPSQLEQILLNLVSNARDAMPHGGILTVSTSEVAIDWLFMKTRGFGRPGKYACIAVSDNGAGMDAVTKDKVFEPFFTTKEMGKGTGLGLSIVYGIVKNHNGYIDVISATGEGTTFLIYLPLLQSPFTEA